MPLIIDGYNLLHVTGVSGKRGDLQGAREALLRLLAATIDPKERPQTTIVFDAADAPPGLPRTVTFEEMTIHYASNYDDADELIEELIATHNVPRSLTVVSSDHRIQRAARRRKAPFIDSDVWIAEASRQARKRRPTEASESKQLASATSEDVGYWIAEFADAPGIEDSRSPSENRERHANREAPSEDENPFPPGYGEDLLGDS